VSSDLGLIAFQDGEPGTFSSDIVLKVLRPFIQPIIDARFPKYWELAFPGGGGGNMEPMLEGTEKNGLAINRPCGTELFDALYEIMRQTHTLLYWTGMDNMITADPSIADHLPPDYIENYGVPPLVKSGADIFGGDRQDVIDYLKQTLRQKRSHISCK
jgi:hypothetical protein